MRRENTAVRRAKFDLSSSVLFAAALLAPTVDALIRPDTARGPEAAEWRWAPPRPELDGTLATLLSFPEKYEQYFNDSVGLRDVLLRCRSIERVFVLDVSPTPTVLIGKERWMFYTGDHSIAVHRGLMPFSAADLELWRVALESQRDFLARREIDYVFVLGPDKESIYPDYMPAGQNRVGPTRMDQLVEYLSAYSTLAILDLRPALSAERKSDRRDDHLYFELGSHWNGRGNQVACREIQKRLRAHFPSVRPIEPEDVVLEPTNYRGDSWARSMYIGDLIAQRPTTLRPSGTRQAQLVSNDGWPMPNHVQRLTVDDPTLPRALIFHDSFGLGLEPVLGESFSHSTWSYETEFDTTLIESEHPDVVIAVFVERLLTENHPETITAK
jgi:alginate O-acetyltransferase complex protein AlgJ